ncbi:MAG: hypothetical protein CR966_00910 [Pseudomonadales bacterium]|nr:MAG: hypothetical protein CR966_00910 [Pseudomonadales bacterium]
MSFVKFLVILLALFAMLAGLVLIYLDVKTRKRKNLTLSDDLHDKDGIPVVPRHLRKFSHQDEEKTESDKKAEEVDVIGVTKDGKSATTAEQQSATDTKTDVKTDTKKNDKYKTVVGATAVVGAVSSTDKQKTDKATDKKDKSSDLDASDVDTSSKSQSANQQEPEIKDKDTGVKGSAIKKTTIDSIEQFDDEPVHDEIVSDNSSNETLANEKISNNKLSNELSSESSNKITEEKQLLSEEAYYTTAQIPAKVKISNAHTDTGLFYDYGNHSLSNEYDSSQNNSVLSETEAEMSSMNDEYQTGYDSSQYDQRVHTSAFKKGFDISRFTDNTPLSDEQLEKSAEVDQNSPLVHAKDNLNISILPIDEFSHISGEKILQMVDDFGFKYGAMNMFHRYQDKDGSGVLWFSMMALTNDGIKPFDINTLPTSMDIKGLVMFLPLPHPKVLQGFDSMMSIAGLIAREIDGFIVDEDGNEITTDYKKRLRALLQSSLED